MWLLHFCCTEFGLPIHVVDLCEMQTPYGTVQLDLKKELKKRFSSYKYPVSYEKQKLLVAEYSTKTCTFKNAWHASTEIIIIKVPACVIQKHTPPYQHNLQAKVNNIVEKIFSHTLITKNLAIFKFVIKIDPFKAVRYSNRLLSSSSSSNPKIPGKKMQHVIPGATLIHHRVSLSINVAILRQ